MNFKAFRLSRSLPSDAVLKCASPSYRHHFPKYSLQYSSHRISNSQPIFEGDDKVKSTAIPTAGAVNRTPRGARTGLSQMMKDYADLSKFRLSSLVVFTSGAGFLCAGSGFEWTSMLVACGGTALCAASAGTFNQVFEIDRDRSMNRTKLRPLPSGRVSPAAAAAWGTTTGLLGTGLLYTFTNPVVAGLGAANIALYAGVYTLSKRYSEINTWIGSIVGAIPPVMGWAAATQGDIFSAEPAALATLLFLWQFPHFFALSWMHREDYARGQFEMVAVNDPTGDRSAELIWRYSLYLTALPLVASASGLTSYMFAVEGTAANAYLLMLAQRFRHDHSNANARRVFLCSLWYLPVLLAAYVFHSRTWNTIEDADKNEVGMAVANAKETLRGLCLHEFISHNETSKTPQMCPKVVAGKTSAKVTDEMSEVQNIASALVDQSIEAKTNK